MVVPNLVVEVVSPRRSRREVHDMALMWLRHGAPLVGVVHPDTRAADVHLASGAASTIGGADGLDGGGRVFRLLLLTERHLRRAGDTASVMSPSRSPDTPHPVRCVWASSQGSRQPLPEVHHGAPVSR